MIKLLSSFSLMLFLFGCSSQEYTQNHTPTVTHHAKRAYNKPYKIKGVWYHPQPVYNYIEEGTASFYGGGDVFDGRNTSTGEKFDMHALTAAHKTLPLPSIVKVTNLDNGRAIKLKVVDRGPFVGERVIDVSRKAARLLGFENKGLTKVRIEALVDESVKLAMNYHPKKPSPEFAAKPGERKQEALKTIFLVQNNSKGQKNIDDLKHPMLLTAAQQPKKQLLAQNQAGGLTAKQLSILRGIYIQVGSYNQSAIARKVASDVQHKHNMPAKAYGSRKSHNSNFKVLAGPFNSSEKAKKLLHRIKTVGHPHAFVIYN